MRTQEAASARTIILHWLTALGIIAMLCFGLVIANMPSGPDKTATIQVHKSFGILVGSLALVRLVNRIREGWLPAVATTLPWEQRAARLTHELMLAATVLMPITGILKSITYGRPVDVFGLRVVPAALMEKNVPWNDVASTAHAAVAFALIALIIVHVFAALKHHFVDRDETLKRMLALKS